MQMRYNDLQETWLEKLWQLLAKTRIRDWWLATRLRTRPVEKAMTPRLGTCDSTRDSTVMTRAQLCIVNSQLTFKTHVNAVAKACNYHIWSFRHIHLLTRDIAHTLARSIVVISKVRNVTTAKVCNAIRHGSPILPLFYRDRPAWARR